MELIWKETIEDVDWEELAALYRAAPLGTKDAAALRTAFSNSRFVLFACEAGRLVGAGRALADGADCSYICDVALLPSHQGHGLGKEIIERLIDLSRGHRKILLYAVPGKEAFYTRFGFRRMKTAMAIFQKPEDAQANGFIE
jgi:GNAT superfamily N-acetyltransferase